MAVQTRSETGETNNYDTVAEAYNVWKKDSNEIFKISFEDLTKRLCRWRPKTRGGWNPVSEKRILLLCPEYSAVFPYSVSARDRVERYNKEVFWVHQLVMHPTSLSFREWKGSSNMSENEYDAEFIVEVLTDEQFRVRYCSI